MHAHSEMDAFIKESMNFAKPTSANKVWSSQWKLRCPLQIFRTSKNLVYVNLSDSTAETFRQVFSICNQESVKRSFG